MTIEEFLEADIPLLCEVVDGRLEYLPMPDRVHSDITIFFLDLFRAAARERGHDPQAAIPPFLLEVDSPFTVRGREPDLLLFLNRDDPRNENRRWTTADLVVEVVSDEGQERDHVEKPADYAAAGVREYWIVDPRPKTPADPRGRTVTVRVLEDGVYRATVYEVGAAAESELLSGLTVPVSAALTGGQG